MYFRLKKAISIFMLCAISLVPVFSHAQSEGEVYIDEQVETYLAEVVSVLEKKRELIPGTDTYTNTQRIQVEILNKDKEGEEYIIENDYLKLEAGDRVYVEHRTDSLGQEAYTITEAYRLHVLMYILLALVLLVIVLGGKKGVLSILSLIGSYAAIYYILFPGILSGYNPVLLSGGLSIVILFFVMYVTHGFKRLTTSAYLGSCISVGITIIFSYISVKAAHLTGFTDDSSVYLNFNTNGTLDFTGLLLGAIIIGVIGIIDDVAITQAAVVSELRAVLPHASKLDIWKRAMSVGRDHMGAVVNSLVLAYTGTALPLMLLMYSSDIHIIEMLNKEFIATEIVRTIIGSIGLMLAVPITTYISILLIRKVNEKDGHGHAHSHTHVH